VSSVSNNYVLVEPEDNKTSVNAVDAGGNEPPLVIPMDTNDNIITEPVTVDSSRPASHVIYGTIPSITNADNHIDSSKVTHEWIKPKFVIVGGKVQRAQHISKQDAHIIDESRSRVLEIRRSLQDMVRGLRDRQSHPQRKKSKKPNLHKKKNSATGASDGWSTEDDEDDIPTASHVVQNRSDLPGMLTDVSVSAPTIVNSPYPTANSSRLLLVLLKL
jgi:hypothetical protein